LLRETLEDGEFCGAVDEVLYLRAVNTKQQFSGIKALAPRTIRKTNRTHTVADAESFAARRQTRGC